jgi:hypothetical protein
MAQKINFKYIWNNTPNTSYPTLGNMVKTVKNPSGVSLYPNGVSSSLTMQGRNITVTRVTNTGRACGSGFTGYAFSYSEFASSSAYASGDVVSANVHSDSLNQDFANLLAFRGNISPSASGWSNRMDSRFVSVILIGSTALAAPRLCLASADQYNSENRFSVDDALNWNAYEGNTRSLRGDITPLVLDNNWGSSTPVENYELTIGPLAWYNSPNEHRTVFPMILSTTSEASAVLNNCFVWINWRN